MSNLATFSSAVVRIPVDAATAMRLHAANEPVIETRNGSFVQFLWDLRVSVDEPAFALAADRAEVRFDGDVPIMDLTTIDALSDARCVVTGYDHDELPEVWHEPCLVPIAVTPLHLAADDDPHEPSAGATAWIRSLPSCDLTALARAHHACEMALAARVEAADALVEQIIREADPQERDQMRAGLAFAKAALPLAPDAYRASFDELDLWEEQDGPETHQYIPEKPVYIAWATCLAAQAATRAIDTAMARSRRDDVLAQVHALVVAHQDDLSERMRLALKTGQLANSLGAARAELLELLAPGWVWKPDKVGEVNNPTEAALAELASVQQEDPTAYLVWADPTNKGWASTTCVAREFLGRTIVRPVQLASASD